MKQKLLLLAVACLALFSCKDEHSNLPDGLYADIETVKGHIIVSLEFEKTPVTVANFVSLAEGKNPFVSPNLKGKNFYDGLKFHRVEPGFVIQGGDPDGNGSGGPGYRFKNEITDLKHDQAGTLSMANAGPGTNGSQFFITLDATPHLDGRHTVFGYVVDGGMTAVNKIVKDDGIISVKIIRKGEKAKKFDAVKVFSDYFNVEVQNEKKAAAKQKTVLDGYRTALVKTASGLQYAIVNKGSGKKPAVGSRVSLNYAGYFEDGSMFDTNIADVARAYGKYDQQRDEQGGYAPMQVPYGQKIGMIPGFLEGINLLGLGEKVVLYIPAALAYGEAGAGNVIPPNTNLIFELELLDKQ